MKTIQSSDNNQTRFTESDFFFFLWECSTPRCASADNAGLGEPSLRQILKKCPVVISFFEFCSENVARNYMCRHIFNTMIIERFCRHVFSVFFFLIWRDNRQQGQRPYLFETWLQKRLIITDFNRI